MDDFTDTLIVGGGLAGLSLAQGLHEVGKDFRLIEARSRFGGRILSRTVEDATFDMGPAWFWPGQPRIDALIEALGLERFDQFAQGDLMYEDAEGVQRGRGYASMEGSYRLKGGLGALIAALARGLPQEKLQTEAPLTSLTRTNYGVEATACAEVIRANRAVLALPPRVAASLSFDPQLSDAAVRTLEAVPTWMAGHAKAIAVFDTPFWRDDGLSGDAMSRVGPMMEIHDASPADGGPFALFGFMGVLPEARRDEDALKAATLRQLERLFGAKAAAPRALMIKDWAIDPFTATPHDLETLYAHPQYGLPQALTGLWDGRLILGSTEVAGQFGGYLEGALEASELVMSQILAAKAG